MESVPYNLIKYQYVVLTTSFLVVKTKVYHRFNFKERILFVGCIRALLALLVQPLLALGFGLVRHLPGQRLRLQPVAGLERVEIGVGDRELALLAVRGQHVPDSGQHVVSFRGLSADRVVDVLEA